MNITLQNMYGLRFGKLCILICEQCVNTDLRFLYRNIILMSENIKDSFFQETGPGILNNRRIAKCVSSYDVLKYRPSRFDKSNHLEENQLIQPLKENKAQQNTDFMFCLKLKMISIASSLGTSQLETNMQIEEDANEILNNLARQIKIYQSEAKKKQMGIETVSKKQEIKLIHLESKIKELESQLSLTKRQLQRFQKSNSMALDRLTKRSKELEEEKYQLQDKVIFMNQIAQQNNRNFQSAKQQLTKAEWKHKAQQEQCIEREKQLLKTINESKQKNIELKNICENQKALIVKKTQEISETWMKYNKVVENLEKTTKKLQNSEEQLRKQEKQLKQMKKNYQNLKIDKQNLHTEHQSQKNIFSTKFTEFSNKLADVAKQIQKLEDSSTMKGFQQITNTANKLGQEFLQMSIQIEEIKQQVQMSLTILEEQHKKQEILLQEDIEIQKKQIKMEIQNYYEDQIQRLNDEIYELTYKMKQK